MRGGFNDYGQNSITPEQEAKNLAIINSLKKIEQERYAALSPEDRKKEDDAKARKKKEDRVNNYKNDLINLYKLADIALNKSEGLLKTDTSFEYDYRNLKQTEFGEKLKDFLKKINKESSIMGKSFSCNDYIDRTFSNIIMQDFGIKESSIDCRGSSQIWKLYNYLIKITSEYLKAFSVSQRENFKKEFRKELSRNLVLICSGIDHQEDVKNMIRDSIEDQQIIGIPYSQNHKDDLLKIYNELDALFLSDGLMKGALLNKEGKKTEFKKKLIDFLRDITLNKCNRAITAIFVNNDNPYFTGIFCSSKNKIQELYNYLNNFEYKNDDEISNKETQKQDLKKKLSKSLIDISFRNKTIQQIIIDTDYLSSQTLVPVNKDNEDIDKKTFNDYISSGVEEKEQKYNNLSAIYKILADYHELYNVVNLYSNVYNQLELGINLNILQKYEDIKGAKLSDKSRYKSTFTSNDARKEEDYDNYDKLIKQIYIDNNNQHTGYLRKKIAKDILLVKIEKETTKLITDISKEITSLQTKLTNYNNNITECERLKKEYEEYLENTENIPPQLGGNTKITKSIKKDILGKSRCIYKKSGDRKQYIKHKGTLITISKYKKLMAAKNTK